jgi:hypothetical protein
MGTYRQLFARRAAAVFSFPPLTHSMAAAKPPSPLVVKLQILGVFCVPLALLGLWLKGKGFW